MKTKNKKDELNGWKTVCEVADEKGISVQAVYQSIKRQEKNNGRKKYHVIRKGGIILIKNLK